MLYETLQYQTTQTRAVFNGSDLRQTTQTDLISTAMIYYKQPNPSLFLQQWSTTNNPNRTDFSSIDLRQTTQPELISTAVIYDK